MTKYSIEILLERGASWPDDAQEEFLKSLADIERKHAGVYKLSDDERAAVRRGLVNMRAGRLASDDAAAALFSH